MYGNKADQTPHSRHRTGAGDDVADWTHAPAVQLPIPRPAVAPGLLVVFVGSASYPFCSSILVDVDTMM